MKERECVCVRDDPRSMYVCVSMCMCIIYIIHNISLSLALSHTHTHIPRLEQTHLLTDTPTLTHKRSGIHPHTDIIR